MSAIYFLFFLIFWIVSDQLQVDSFATARDGETHEATRRLLSVLLRQVKIEFPHDFMMKQNQMSACTPNINNFC